MERLCADALVAAECRIEDRIAARVESNLRIRLNALLSEDVDGRLSRFIWLRQFEVGKNSADINRLLDRLECLQDIALPQAVLDDIPSYQITRLRRQGERYFTDGLRDITSTRPLLSWQFAPWSGRQRLRMLSLKPMIGLSARYGGRQRGSAKRG